MGLSYMAYINLRYILYPFCWKFLSWKDVVFHQMLFLHLLRKSWFLSFILLMWCITFIDLCMLNHSYVSGINSTWSWCMILLMCCSIFFYCFSGLYFIWFCSDFCCFLSSANFCCSLFFSLNFLMCEVRLFIWDIYFFLT